MADYMSDNERDQQYDTAMLYIKQAKRLNKEVQNLRITAGNDSITFGTIGSQLDEILTEAAAIDSMARDALFAIDDNAQPVIDLALPVYTGIIYDNTADTIRWTDDGSSTTDFPSSGDIEITGSSLGNDGTYTVSGRTGKQLSLSGTPTLVDGTETSRTKIIWKTY